MSYSSDIDALGNDHRYKFNGGAVDQVGTSNGTNTGGSFGGANPPLCEGLASSYSTNSNDDNLSLPSISTINDSANTRKAVCGWFATNSIQTPPRSIYNEGTVLSNFQFILAYGNNCMLEVTSGSFSIQIFGPVIVPDRAYHLCGIFEGNGYSNSVRFYVDGVEQTLSVPSNKQPNSAGLETRAQGRFGRPLASEGIGGALLLITAPVSGFYNEWAFWGDKSQAQLTSTQVKEVLFEKGALPLNTITSGTQSVIQAELTLDESNVNGTNTTNDIRIEQVTGNGNLQLNLINRTFDPLSSIHIQYMGTGILTIINTGTSNASKGSTPNGGTIIFKNEVNISVTAKDASTGVAIVGARVYLLDSSGNIVVNGLTNSSGVITSVYKYESDDIVSSSSRIRKGSSSPFYKTAPISGTITSFGLTTTILMIKDE